MPRDLTQDNLSGLDLLEPRARAADSSRLPPSEGPRIGLGMTALVLGLIGILFTFLPVLAFPISVCGLVLGAIGLVAGFFSGGPALRWSIEGVVVCIVALSTNLIINFLPEGYALPNPSPARAWRQPADRPYVPPPAAR